MLESLISKIVAIVGLVLLAALIIELNHRPK